MIRSFVCIFLASSVVVIAQDEVRSTQEELRRRNIYFGDINGQRSGEYSEALKRYQQRKGLANSGKEDRDTLRSLGLRPRSPNEPPAKELEWPAEPVLKSDTKLDVIAAAEEIAAETGVSRASVAPAASGSRRKAPVRSTTSAAPRTAAPPRADSAPRFSLRNSGTLSKEVTRFVSDYFKAVSGNDLAKELHFYADRVDYFAYGPVDRRVIEQSLRKYYQRWDKRSYTVQQPVALNAVPNRGEIVLTFRVNFALRNGGSQVRGQTENRLVINAATADPRIVSIQERRVRR